MMKRILSLVVTLLLLLAGTQAFAVNQTGVLEGAACWPEGTDEATASYIYRYSYPMVEEDDDVGLMINQYYRYLVDDALAFTVPINGESMSTDEGQFVTELTGKVTFVNEAYLSVCFEQISRIGDEVISTIYSSNVFALTGAKAGSIVSLPYLLGILGTGEADEWLETRQTAKADDCVRRMIWETLEDMIEDGDIAFWDDLDYDLLCEVFYPEEDFFLNESGDPVFYLEEGSIAEPEAGALMFPIPLEDILDEL